LEIEIRQDRDRMNRTRRALSAAAFLPAIAFAFAAALLVPVSTLAGDHLQPRYCCRPDHPEDKLIDDDYRSLMQRVFAPAFAEDVRVRAISDNPLMTNEVVGLRHRGNVWEVFGLEAEGKLFDFVLVDQERRKAHDEKRDVDQAEIDRLLEGEPADPAQLKINSCALRVPESLADSIEAVWDRMLAGSRELTKAEAELDHPTINNMSTLTVDGTFLEFQSGTLSGDIYAPDAKGAVRDLNHLASVMGEACWDRNRKQIATMRVLARKISRELYLPPPAPMLSCKISKACTIRGILNVQGHVGSIRASYANSRDCVAVALPANIADAWTGQAVQASGMIDPMPDLPGLTSYKLKGREVDVEACTSGLVMYVDRIEPFK
jgi:hypothetical protein